MSVATFAHTSVAKSPFSGTGLYLRRILLYTRFEQYARLIAHRCSRRVDFDIKDIAKLKQKYSRSARGLVSFAKPSQNY